MYFLFGFIGTMTIIAAWVISDVTMKVFFISALFAILLAVTSIIVSGAFAKKNSIVNEEIKTKLDVLLGKFDTNKPTITEITLPSPDLAQLPYIIEEWKIVIQTQMHFNDLIMKVRTATLSVVLAVFGAAGYSFTAEKISPFSYAGIGTIHPSAFIISSGIVILIAVFVVDYNYYYKMLIGAVKRGYEFDKEFQGLQEKFGRRYFGMSSTIRDSIGNAGKSKYFVMLFYIIPIIGGIVFLLAVLIGYQPPTSV